MYGTNSAPNHTAWVIAASGKPSIWLPLGRLEEQTMCETNHTSYIMTSLFWIAALSQRIDTPLCISQDTCKPKQTRSIKMQSVLEIRRFVCKAKTFLCNFYNYSELAFLVLSTRSMDRDARLHVARYIPYIAGHEAARQSDRGISRNSRKPVRW